MAAADRPIACLTFVGDPATDTRILRTADALSDDFEIHIVALTSAEESSVEGATVHPISYPEGKPLRSALFSFWKSGAALCATLGATLCVASDLYSLPAAARGARVTESALVYDSRELYGAIAALQGKRLRQHFWNIIERRYASGASVILTVNEEIAAILRKHYPDVPVHVSYNVPMHSAGVDSARGELREMFSIPENQSILISNGGLQKGRGLFDMIAMLEHLPDCHLVFLGNGPLRSELELFAHGNDCEERVHFMHVPSKDVVRWTAAADIGLCFVENLGLSYYLSLPNKFFEYMHAEIPSVCTDLLVVRILIEKHEVGVLVPHNDGEKAAEAIKLLRREPAFYEGFTVNARRASHEFSWKVERARLRDAILHAAQP